MSTPLSDAIIIPHKFRPERRALWLKSERKVRYQYLSETGEWQADYTIWEWEIGRDGYFREYYGVLPAG